MKKMTGMKWLGLLAAGLLGLWPVGGLRAQAAATMAATETSAETVKCDTIRMTWEAEAGEEKSLSFAFKNKISFFTVDWGDGVSSEDSRGSGTTITMKHVYVEAGTYEVLLYAMPYVKPIGLVGESYTETAFGLGMPMTYVQGGTFLMGSYAENDELPVHTVALSSFYMGKYEVTQGQWMEVMGTTIEQQRDKAGASNLYGVGDNYPMYYVSWEEANEFCKKLSQKTGKTYRLPTEAEWEYAACGGQNNDGAGSNKIDEVAWYIMNSGDKAHPVGLKKPNGLGLYDMIGNVKEWCQDWYGLDYYSESPVVNPQGPTGGSYRVYRGGSWGNDAQRCRVSYRIDPVPAYWNDRYFGFRVVCEP